MYTRTVQFVGRTHVHTDCVGQQLYTARAARVAHMRDPLAADRARDGVHRVRGATSRPKTLHLRPLAQFPLFPGLSVSPAPNSTSFPPSGAQSQAVFSAFTRLLHQQIQHGAEACVCVCVCVHFQQAKTVTILFCKTPVPPGAIEILTVV